VRAVRHGNPPRTGSARAIEAWPPPGRVICLNVGSRGTGAWSVVQAGARCTTGRASHRPRPGLPPGRTPVEAGRVVGDTTVLLRPVVRDAGPGGKPSALVPRRCKPSRGSRGPDGKGVATAPQDSGRSPPPPHDVFGLQAGAALDARPLTWEGRPCLNASRRRSAWLMLRRAGRRY